MPEVNRHLLDLIGRLGDRSAKLLLEFSDGKEDMLAGADAVAPVIGAGAIGLSPLPSPQGHPVAFSGGVAGQDVIRP